jgi:hypothetical protein
MEMQDVVNAAMSINVLISHDRPNKEIPAPVDVFELFDEAVDVWV